MTTFEVIVLLLAFGEFILNLVSTITKFVEKRDKKNKPSFYLYCPLRLNFSGSTLEVHYNFD